MISKKQANEISDVIIETKRIEDKNSNNTKVNFIYGHLLGKDILRKYSDSPGSITQAIKKAQNSWQVVLVVFAAFVIAVSAWMFLENPLNFVVVLTTLAGTSALIKKLIKSKIIFYLEKERGNA